MAGLGSSGENSAVTCRFSECGESDASGNRERNAAITTSNAAVTTGLEGCRRTLDKKNDHCRLIASLCSGDSRFRTAASCRRSSDETRFGLARSASLWGRSNASISRHILYAKSVGEMYTFRSRAKHARFTLLPWRSNPTKGVHVNRARVHVDRVWRSGSYHTHNACKLLPVLQVWNSQRYRYFTGADCGSFAAHFGRWAPRPFQTVKSTAQRY